MTSSSRAEAAAHPNLLPGPFTAKEQAKLQELRSAGCQLWQLTPDNLATVAAELEHAGFHTRPITNHDGTRLLGLTINGHPAYIGEVFIRRPSGRNSICPTAAMRTLPKPGPGPAPPELPPDEHTPA